MDHTDSARQIGHLGERLRQLRAERGLSIADVVRGTQISRSRLNEYESDPTANPTLDKLVALATFYGLHSIEELFGPLPSSALMVDASDTAANAEDAA